MSASLGMFCHVIFEERCATTGDDYSTFHWLNATLICWLKVNANVFVQCVCICVCVERGYHLLQNKNNDKICCVLNSIQKSDGLKTFTPVCKKKKVLVQYKQFLKSMFLNMFTTH